MVSRRKILSRSRDDLNLDQTFIPQEEEEDIWYQKDKLFKEHIQEVLDKWTQIDDEIWAKVIVFERNRRVAKAYARAPVLTINGSDDGFDGMRIGLCGFDNPMRDQKTDELKRHIGQGVKIKMDDAGNILIRRYAKSNVYIKSTANSLNEETAIGADILKLPNQTLESEKIVKLFDMKKFQSNVNRELRRAYPDRRRLETQCLSAVAFVKSESDVLECPVWVLIVNVVAMDMLKSKLPPVQRPVDIKNRPRIPIPDEDPYSVAGNGGGSSGSSGFGANGGTPSGHVAATREQLLLQTQQLAQRRSEKPPKLPPRDIYGHDIPKPDYDDIEAENRLKTFSRSSKSDKGKDNKKYDDPYYCGLRARVPNFVKSSKSSKEKDNTSTLLSQKKTSVAHMQSAPLHGMHPIYQHQHIIAAHHQHQQQLAQQQQHQQQLMWHARSYESGIGIYSHMNYMLDHPYSTTTCPYQIYGHTTNYTDVQRKPIDENFNSSNVIINNTNAGAVESRRRIHQQCYRTCSNDCYMNQQNASPYGYGTSNKWHSESDIINLDKDDTTDQTIYGSNDLKTDSSLRELSDNVESRNGSPINRRKINHKQYQKKVLNTKPPTIVNSHCKNMEPSRRKSASIESFFHSEPPYQSNSEIYERVKSGQDVYVTQKKKIDQHLRKLAEKDNTREIVRGSNSSYSKSEKNSHNCQEHSRLSRNHDRNSTNNRRERSMYDFRSKNKDKFDSDMESIYGYLKPRKPRGHGLKSFPK